jgi:hypothetical protein
MMTSLGLPIPKRAWSARGAQRAIGLWGTVNADACGPANSAQAKAPIMHNRCSTIRAGGRVRLLIRFFSTAHALIAVLFTAVALMFLVIAAHTGWDAIGLDPLDSANQAIEAIGLLAIAVVSLQIAQTITEEEVIRESLISAPTRLRRYLSRFFVVLIIALAVEGLVSTFKSLHEDPTMLPYAATVLVATGVLLAAWGLFIWCNKSVEVLEPEAMEEAKKEDTKLER